MRLCFHVCESRFFHDAADFMTFKSVLYLAPWFFTANLKFGFYTRWFGGAVAWWLTPQTPDPEVGGSSPDRVAVLCP